MTALQAPRAGDAIPPLTLPPLTRAALALYAGGSGDHIPLHIDSDFARAAGHKDVFMHGMLGVAYLMRMLTAWVPQECVVAYGVRFVHITYPGDVLTARGTIREVHRDGRVDVDIVLSSAEREARITGWATVDLTMAPRRE